MAAEIESILQESRLFDPPKDFSSQAHVKGRERYDALCQEAAKDYEGFWAKAAKELKWRTPWKTVLQWNLPFAKWFVEGTLNVSENCVDRHLEKRADKPAIIWEGEPGDQRTLTYKALSVEVNKAANALKTLGVKKGDRVVIYLPMIPEAAIAMLACARIGATHSVVFGGFSGQALRDRINDSKAVCVITADGGYRRGVLISLKVNVDEALKEAITVKHVVVVKRGLTPFSGAWKPNQDHWFHELLENASADCPAEPVEAEYPLFILYTSGTTGKPKGVVHSTGGYLTQVALTTKWVFDLKEDDVYWCTADVGWVTGHSYVVYGPLANGATVVMYEGAPNHPQPDRFWEIIERYKVTKFYTAPTAIRAFMKWGDEWPKKHDLSSLRLLGSVGEPINPEAWMWYRDKIGNGHCPIVDTWWQTETGAILITPLPGAISTKPGSATLPFPGIDAEVVDQQGKPVPSGGGGFLVIRQPWPSMMRTIYGDDERYKQTYWTRIPGVYFTGDGARRDEHGYFWIMGRVDDVMKVSGHLLSTMEIESALVSHPMVAEAAVVGRPDNATGQAVVAFVSLRGTAVKDGLTEILKKHVTKEIGAIARPAEIRFVDGLPKTRSGKIMRRLLREIASSGKVTGDTTTLEDLSALEKLKSVEEE